MSKFDIHPDAYVQAIEKLQAENEALRKELEEAKDWERELMKPKKKCCANCVNLGIEEDDDYFCLIGSDYIPNEDRPGEYLHLFPLNEHQIQFVSCDDNYKEIKDLNLTTAEVFGK